MFVASGRTDSAEGISLEDTQCLYDALRNLLVDVCLKGATFNHPSDDPPHEFIERWLAMLRNADTKWPAGSAKPVALEDDHRLSVMMKMSYLGAIRQFEP